MQHKLHLGIDFSLILIDFRSQVGVENRPKIDAKRCRKNDHKKNDNKMTKNRSKVDLPRGGSLLGDHRLGPAAPWGGGIRGEGHNPLWTGSPLSRHANGPRPGELITPRVETITLSMTGKHRRTSLTFSQINFNIKPSFLKNKRRNK